MITNFSELQEKEVVNLKDGSKLGYVDDMKINTCDAQIISLIIEGRKKCFGLFGRDEDIVVPWKCIEVIGEDTILVSVDCGRECSPKKFGFLKGMFG